VRRVHEDETTATSRIWLAWRHNDGGVLCAGDAHASDLLRHGDTTCEMLRLIPVSWAELADHRLEW
jgi:hypothetical protein